MKHKIISRETVFKAHIFSAEKIKLALPDGRERFYDLVDHGAAVMIVPVTADGKILFVKQFRLGAEKEILELPAGVLNAGEDADIAAGRELREETGNAAADIRGIGKIYMTPGYCTEYIFVYLAENLSPDPLPQDDDEFLELVAISVEDAYRMAEDGELEDAKTFAGLMLAQKFIRSKFSS